MTQQHRRRKLQQRHMRWQLEHRNCLRARAWLLTRRISPLSFQKPLVWWSCQFKNHLQKKCFCLRLQDAAYKVREIKHFTSLKLKDHPLNKLRLLLLFFNTNRPCPKIKQFPNIIKNTQIQKNMSLYTFSGNSLNFLLKRWKINFKKRLVKGHKVNLLKNIHILSQLSKT